MNSKLQTNTAQVAARSVSVAAIVVLSVYSLAGFIIGAALAGLHSSGLLVLLGSVAVAVGAWMSRAKPALRGAVIAAGGVACGAGLWWFLAAWTGQYTAGGFIGALLFGGGIPIAIGVSILVPGLAAKRSAAAGEPSAYFRP